MLNKIWFFIIVFLTFSSSFLFVQKEEVNAAPCTPGSYPSLDASKHTYSCKVISSNKGGDTKTNALTQIDYTKDPASGKGPMWAQKTARYFVALSIVIGYATEAVAIIMVAYASYLYTTSEGDLQKMRRAKMVILYAFIGMFIGLFALTISRVVGGVL